MARQHLLEGWVFSSSSSAGHSGTALMMWSLVASLLEQPAWVHWHLAASGSAALMWDLEVQAWTSPHRS